MEKPYHRLIVASYARKKIYTVKSVISPQSAFVSLAMLTRHAGDSAGAAGLSDRAGKGN